jgi:hypothetical protein
MGAKIVYSFEHFPFFNGKRPALASGEVEIEIMSVKPPVSRTNDLPYPPGDHEIYTWRMNRADLWLGRKGKVAADLGENAWLRQDLERWLRGKHGFLIEQALRKVYRKLALPSEGEK